MKDRIIITGGSGFIGSSLFSYLFKLGDYEVVNIDIEAPECANYFDYWKKINILNSSELNRFIITFQPSYIIHLAAKTDLGGNSLEAYKTNTVGTKNLIEASRHVKSIKKIIFFSSMLVCKAGYIPTTDCDYDPPNYYGKSKVAMERMIRSEQYLWEWTILRPTSIWGPGFKEPYKNFFETVANGRFLDIGDHYSTKTYGYIGNTVYQIYEILRSSTTNGKTLYLGDDPPIFISAWAKEVAEAMKLPHPRKISFSLVKLIALLGDTLKAFGIKFPMTSFRLKNMTTNNIIDLSELYKVAPDPPYTRMEGIIKTVEWLKQQKN